MSVTVADGTSASAIATFIILIMPIDLKDSSEWDSDIRQEICGS
jgi:hypothetical protein